ncbi:MULTISPECIES: hypothetical protein [Pseudomonas fluorescens group]|jgi:hypothetical protein|uniref:Uncharacterized protein n=1 Tax=Pseudomonas petroselini TaxID=2899822 RepID=A0ABS8QMP6_9PSED|nr:MULTISPECIES: hypothetical protein [Pseudomonas fluorescens group]MCD7036939.1 hypothetical protein [Pseudomonas petroselini]MCD7044360.1 hypothetical protein [Pseudomonas petroselini]MCD7066901.1 hypothetical protein [Pseudomonas petroselini]MCD7078540.1 hypothetical protein [Pseudomonas petroselini]MCF5669213.1 hypothetical protein [Pseudomonas marginalis]
MTIPSGGYSAGTPYYGMGGANTPSAGSSGGNGGVAGAEDNFDKGEAINDYTTKRQLDAKLISGINQAAKAFQ